MQRCTGLYCQYILDNAGTVDGFKLTVLCNGSWAELEWLNKLDNVGLVNIEYSFYNLTSGYNVSKSR